MEKKIEEKGSNPSLKENDVEESSESDFEDVAIIGGYKSPLYPLNNHYRTRYNVEKLEIEGEVVVKKTPVSKYYSEWVENGIRYSSVTNYIIANYFVEHGYIREFAGVPLFSENEDGKKSFSILQKFEKKLENIKRDVVDSHLHKIFDAFFDGQRVSRFNDLFKQVELHDIIWVPSDEYPWLSNYASRLTNYVKTRTQAYKRLHQRKLEEAEKEQLYFYYKFEQALTRLMLVKLSNPRNLDQNGRSQIESTEDLYELDKTRFDDLFKDLRYNLTADDILTRYKNGDKEFVYSTLDERKNIVETVYKKNCRQMLAKIKMREREVIEREYIISILTNDKNGLTREEAIIEYNFQIERNERGNLYSKIKNKIVELYRGDRSRLGMNEEVENDIDNTLKELENEKDECDERIREDITESLSVKGKVDEVGEEVKSTAESEDSQSQHSDGSLRSLSLSPSSEGSSVHIQGSTHSHLLPPSIKKNPTFHFDFQKFMKEGEKAEEELSRSRRANEEWRARLSGANRRVVQAPKIIHPDYDSPFKYDNRDFPNIITCLYYILLSEIPVMKEVETRKQATSHVVKVRRKTLLGKEKAYELLHRQSRKQMIMIKHDRLGDVYGKAFHQNLKKIFEFNLNKALSRKFYKGGIYRSLLRSTGDKVIEYRGHRKSMLSFLDIMTVSFLNEVRKEALSEPMFSQLYISKPSPEPPSKPPTETPSETLEDFEKSLDPLWLNDRVSDFLNRYNLIVEHILIDSQRVESEASLRILFRNIPICMKSGQVLNPNSIADIIKNTYLTFLYDNLKTINPVHRKKVIAYQQEVSKKKDACEKYDNKPLCILGVCLKILSHFQPLFQTRINDDTFNFIGRFIIKNDTYLLTSKETTLLFGETLSEENMKIWNAIRDSGFSEEDFQVSDKDRIINRFRNIVHDIHHMDIVVDGKSVKNNRIAFLMNIY